MANEPTVRFASGWDAHTKAAIENGKDMRDYLEERERTLEARVAALEKEIDGQRQKVGRVLLKARNEGLLTQHDFSELYARLKAEFSWPDP